MNLRIHTLLHVVLATFIVIPKPFFAEEPALAEKIHDSSPDQKFALRISYDQKENERLVAELKYDPGEHVLPDGMFSRAVTEIDLVSLPAKEKLVELYKPELGMNFGDITLLWSTDSQWCAFYVTQLGTGDTQVYKQQDGKFAKINSGADDLHVKLKGDFRNEWIRPIKWVKPGLLILEDEATGNSGHVKFELTVTLDAGGKVHVLSQKKLKVKADTN
jgi:hypothetical protein